MNQDQPIFIRLNNDMEMRITALPHHATTEETVYEGPDRNPRQKTVYTWINAKGEMQARCFADQVMAVSSAPFEVHS